jgi:restriction endonuclease Mrr
MGSSKRRKTVTVFANVDVDVDVSIEEVLTDMSDEDFAEIARERGWAPEEEVEVDIDQARDLVADLRETVASHDMQHFEVLMLRVEDAVGIPRPVCAGARKTKDQDRETRQ